ncbi:hypothetical protein D3C80_1374950 [compost metagenome]
MALAHDPDIIDGYEQFPPETAGNTPESPNNEMQRSAIQLFDQIKIVKQSQPKPDARRFPFKPLQDCWEEGADIKIGSGNHEAHICCSWIELNW